MSLQNASISLFTLATALLAGFFFAFTNPTMMAFANTTPEIYVAAMQEINRSVQNLTFFTLFAGTPVLGIAALALTRNPWIAAGTVLALFSAILTMTQNVPMNEAMDQWTATTIPNPTEIEAFRARWMTLNTIRTVASTLAAICGLMFLATNSRDPNN